MGEEGEEENDMRSQKQKKQRAGYKELDTGHKELQMSVVSASCDDTDEVIK